MIETDVDATDLALADFSDDRRIDLLLAGAEFRLFLGDPAGGFEGAMAVPTWAAMQSQSGMSASTS